MSLIESPVFTLTAALAIGFAMQKLAPRVHAPGIVLLLLAGVVFGPDLLGLIQPESLGPGLSTVVGLAVAAILFDGGLNLNHKRIRREETTIRRLITIGAIVTAAGGAIASRLFMGWGWRASILFGTLIIVTGPTVTTPLLRRIQVKKNVETILEAEGVLIDPIGAIIAVVALETLYGSGPAAAGFLGVTGRILAGVSLGSAGGLLIAVFLRYSRFVPSILESILTLGLVLTLFEASNTIIAESGIMASVIAGLVVGNVRTGADRRLRHFNDHLATLLIGLLFILLTADVRLAELHELGWPGVATVAALILIVRPLDIIVSTWGSTLSPKERTFIAWLAPRGIVAAAVASLFAERLEAHGTTVGTELRALVFLVIAVTVVVQGLSGGAVAGRLGVQREE